MSLEKRSKYLVFKFWETMYDICYLVFGNLPVTYDVKHKMNMAYMRYQMKRDWKTDAMIPRMMRRNAVAGFLVYKVGKRTAFA